MNKLLLSKLLVLVKLLKSQFKAQQIEVTGLLDAGAAAIFAGCFTDGISKVTAVNAPASFLFDNTTVSFVLQNAFAHYLPDAIYSIALSIPGFLKWGDISLAVALNSGKVDFVSPRTFDGTPGTPAQIKAWKAEISAVRKKLS